MARKNNQAPLNFITLAIDIGFGATKVIALVNGQFITFVFPSVFAHAFEMRYQSEKTKTDYRGERLLQDGVEYFVGNLAQKHANPAQIRSILGNSSSKDEFNLNIRLMFFKVALAKLLPGKRDGDAVHVHIITGLPVSTMKNAPAMRDSLIGAHSITTDDTNFIANVVSASVMPQPQGVVYSSMLTNRGEINEYYTFSTSGVVDLGRFSVDVSLDREGEYIDAQSGTVEAGMHIVQERVSQYYIDQFGIAPSHETIEKIIVTKGAKIANVPHDFSDVVNAGIREMADASITLMTSLWGTGAEIDVIRVAGGGAKYSYPLIKKVFPHAVMGENAQFDVVQG